MRKRRRLELERIAAIQRWESGDVAEFYQDKPTRIIRDTPVKLLSEKRFSPIHAVPGDEIKWTFEYGPEGHEVPVVDYTEPVTEVIVFDTFRCYYADEFDGLKNAYIGMAGHTPAEEGVE